MKTLQYADNNIVLATCHYGSACVLEDKLLSGQLITSGGTKMHPEYICEHLRIKSFLGEHACPLDLGCKRLTTPVMISITSLLPPPPPLKIVYVRPCFRPATKVKKGISKSDIIIRITEQSSFQNEVVSTIHMLRS